MHECTRCHADTETLRADPYMDGREVCERCYIPGPAGTLGTSIRSNGSKWYGQQHDTIDDLIAVLAAEPLRPDLDPFVCFKDTYVATGLPVPGVGFLGNFHRVSHVFHIQTDEAALIERLIAAIRANIASEAYKAALREWGLVKNTRAGSHFTYMQPERRL